MIFEVVVWVFGDELKLYFELEVVIKVLGGEGWEKLLLVFFFVCLYYGIDFCIGYFFRFLLVFV